jgi:hypothetical protein
MIGTTNPPYGRRVPALGIKVDDVFIINKERTEIHYTHVGRRYQGSIRLDPKIPKNMDSERYLQWLSAFREDMFHIGAFMLDIEHIPLREFDTMPRYQQIHYVMAWQESRKFNPYTTFQKQFKNFQERHILTYPQCWEQELNMPDYIENSFTGCWPEDLTKGMRVLKAFMNQ